MFPKIFTHSDRLCAIGLLFLALAGCIADEPTVQPTPEDISLPNPAAVFCEQHAGRNENRTDSSGGQYGVCVFDDGSECDQWAFFRGECQPGQSGLVPSPKPSPNYTNQTFGFSFNSADWAVEENPNYLLLTRPGYRLFVGFQSAGEDPMPFRTGMPEGEFVDGGTGLLLGQLIPKQILVFNGKNKVVSYGGRIQAGNLVLVMYLDAVETNEVSYADLDIPPEIMAEADQIIASFTFTSGEIPTLQLP